MLIDLADATPSTSGGKAAPLARLLAAGLDVPSGFVVPIRAFEDSLAGFDVVGAARRSIGAVRKLVERAVLSPMLVEEIAVALVELTSPSGGGFVAVRSSACDEDDTDAAAAGQYDTVLGVRGPDQVADAVRKCWASLWSERAVAYRQRQGLPGSPRTAVLVQRLVDADVAGVLFTGPSTRIEASLGLGISVVAGQVTPDCWMVTNGKVQHRTIGAKSTRTDRVGTQVVTSQVPPLDRDHPCLTDAEVLELASMGGAIKDLFGQPQDIEWAIADGRTWILQARPITASLPDVSPASTDAAATSLFTGTPASPGIAAGPARIVRGPNDFTGVQPGEVLVCGTTDPSWTPLIGVVAAVITETGGLLSHAAIVAREQAIPAVVAVPHATTSIPDGAYVEVNGTTGQVALIT